MEDCLDVAEVPYMWSGLSTCVQLIPLGMMSEIHTATLA